MDEGYPTVIIDNYTVAYGAFSSLSQEPGGGPEMAIQIDLHAAPNQQLEDVWLSFEADAAGRLGRINNTRSRLVVYFPPSSFGDIYRVLQAERPIYVEYSIKKDSDELWFFYVKTDKETVGEGPVDPDKLVASTSS